MRKHRLRISPPILLHHICELWIRKKQSIIKHLELVLDHL